MPEFCRDKYDFAKSQESFIRCVVMKMFESFNGKFEVFKLTDILNQFFVDVFEIGAILRQLKMNYARLKETLGKW